MRRGGGADLVPDGAERRRVAVPVAVGGGRGRVELARDRERRGVAGRLPHPVPVRRRLLRRRRRRRCCVLHLRSFSPQLPAPTTGGSVSAADLSARRGAGTGKGVACAPILTGPPAFARARVLFPFWWQPLRSQDTVAWARVPDAS